MEANNNRRQFLNEQLGKYPPEPESCFSDLPDFVEVGKFCHIHPHVNFNYEGFGYEQIGESWIHIPHSGKVVIEDFVDIFEGTNIVRATADDGETRIGAGTKIDCNVHIAHNVKIGKNCLIVAGAIIGGSVEIGDNCYLGMGCMIKNKVVIGNNVTIGMGAVVLNSIIANHTAVGNPAKIIDVKY
jgi:UDP-3-O-[3-hydroxymyristoyl] glucosamine N-acyltransferase